MTIARDFRSNNFPFSMAPPPSLYLACDTNFRIVVLDRGFADSVPVSRRRSDGAWLGNLHISSFLSITEIGLQICVLQYLILRAVIKTKLRRWTVRWLDRDSLVRLDIVNDVVAFEVRQVALLQFGAEAFDHVLISMAYLPSSIAHFVCVLVNLLFRRLVFENNDVAA